MKNRSGFSYYIWSNGKKGSGYSFNSPNCRATYFKNLTYMSYAD